MFSLGSYWQAEWLDVVVTLVAFYAVRMCGNTFTKAMIKDRMHIG